MEAKVTAERPVETITVVDVWLEAGRDGRTFSYCDRAQLGVGLGQLLQSDIQLILHVLHLLLQISHLVINHSII